MFLMQQGRTSYWSWACSLSTLIGKTISKQAIFDRMQKPWVATVRTLLEHVMVKQVTQQVTHHLFKHFKQVWVQDSTTLHLPDILSEQFKGNKSKGQTKAVAKLNVVMDVLSGVCKEMKWMSFTVTEQYLASSILETAKAGDLVIRDMGYFVLKSFKQMKNKGIDFLSRLKYATSLHEVKTGKRIDLHKLVKNKAWIDMQVLCGKDKDLPVRLVAIKLPAEQAEVRRRRAKKDRDKRLNHSKAYYELLGYVIFITTVNKKVWNYQQVSEAYRIRWNIEILFKSWKSGFHMSNLIPEAKTQTARVESILYLMLLYITWFQILIYIPLRWYLNKQGKYLSMIKAVKWIRANTMVWIKGRITSSMRKEIAYFCCYDTRGDRINAEKQLEQFYIAFT